MFYRCSSSLITLLSSLYERHLCSVMWCSTIEFGVRSSNSWLSLVEHPLLLHIELQGLLHSFIGISSQICRTSLFIDHVYHKCVYVLHCELEGYMANPHIMFFQGMYINGLCFSAQPCTQHYPLHDDTVHSFAPGLVFMIWLRFKYRNLCLYILITPLLYMTKAMSPYCCLSVVL